MVQQMNITEICIKKFRSIDDGVIKFDSPVKVLIGPNGTGKTNLLLALRFLSSCINHSPVRAIQQAGGLDKVFTIRERRAKELSFRITADVKRPRPHSRGVLNEKYGTIVYSFSLQFEETSKVLLVRSESLTLETVEDNLKRSIFSRKSDTKKTKIDSTMDSSQISGSSELGEHVGNNELALIRLFVLFDRSRMMINARAKSDIDYNPLFQITNVMGQVIDELSTIVAYNFDPSELRRSSDLLSAENMSYSGKGFSSLLQRLTTEKYFTRQRFSQLPRSHHRENFFSQFADIYKEILPFIDNVEPNENIDTTSVELQFKEIQQLNTTRKFGTGHLSDGSLKFLAVVTTILLPNYGLMCVEEIENYLNPVAIRRLIDLMKDIADSTGRKFLITSHSETVLNAMDANDVIVSRRNRNGSTTYEKFNDLSKIQDAMEAGGLGLGYLWGRGGLDGF